MPMPTEKMATMEAAMPITASTKGNSTPFTPSEALPASKVQETRAPT